MSKRILLADDSVTIQKVVELTFMDEGFDVTAVGNGDDALERMDEVRPDLVIADVHMPGASGYEVCRKVKETSPQIPVMLLVGTFQPFDEAEAEECGADDHLKKPFDSQELFRRVEGLMAAAEDTQDSDFSVDPLVLGVEAVEPEPTIVPVALSEPDSDLETAEDVVSDSTEVESASEAVDEPVPFELDDDQVDRIARRVVELLGEDVVREVSWEVIPDLAEVVIKDRLRDLENQID